MMDAVQSESREVRAGRNQSLFRALNERLTDLNESLGTVSEGFVVVCECADSTCVEQLELKADEYERVRGNPRWFVVLPGHVYADVEKVITEEATYVVVEKLAAAAEIAEGTIAGESGRN